MRGITAAAALLLGGCYLAHDRVEFDAGPVPRIDAGRETDAGRRRDSGPLRDAGGTEDVGRRDHVWTMEPARVELSYEGCEARTSTAIFVTLDVRLDGRCERAGPVEVRPPGEDELAWHVAAWKWVEHGVDCRGPRRTERRTAAIATGIGVGGSFLDVREDHFGSTLRVRLDPPPSFVCDEPPGVGEMCREGCCGAGLACAALRGDAVCGSLCTIPCDIDLDCDAGAECSETSTTASGCAGRAINECMGDADCGPRMRCVVWGAPVPANSCDWAGLLGATDRHPCGTDEDCGPALHCVETLEGARSCQIPCWTQAMRCPPMHACRPLDGRSGWPWVCEWLGE